MHRHKAEYRQTVYAYIHTLIPSAKTNREVCCFFNTVAQAKCTPGSKKTRLLPGS